MSTWCAIPGGLGESFAAAGLHCRMQKVIWGGSRAQTFERFSKVVAERRLGAVHLLLVDSECPVMGDGSVWSHLEEWLAQT